VVWAREEKAQNGDEQRIIANEEDKSQEAEQQGEASLPTLRSTQEGLLKEEPQMSGWITRMHII